MDLALRDTLADIIREETAGRADRNAESAAMMAWNAYQGAQEYLAAPMLDMSKRGRQTRAILRIAQSYGWQSAIAHFLDTKGVPYISDLTEPQLDDLADRMDGYVDAVMCGYDSPDSPPAF